ncbi:MAG: uroporphyrinogen-III synthase [Mariprofundales bacterium]|nr:uroporphyrinogen-III synthase [Mariprofundales bacterium]
MTGAESAPLTGRTVLITRAAHQAQSTLDAVAQRGGRGVLLPCLEILYNGEAVACALQALADDPCAPLLITSVNGVDSLLADRDDGEVGRLIGRRRQVVAVGDSSAAALRRLGVDQVVVPQPFSQLGVAAWWREHGWPERLIFVRAERGRDDLLPLLDAHGCLLRLFSCYGSRIPAQPAPQEVVQALRGGRIDAVLVGSSATARGLVARVGADLAARPVAVAISQRVADEARRLGLRVQVVAAEASFDGMLDKLEVLYATA